MVATRWPPTAPAAVSMSFQPTDPTTNQLIGTPNQTVPIAAMQGRTFVLTFQSGSALTVSGLAPVFGCDGVQAAPITSGVNTVDLSFSATPVADIIALAATAPDPGVVDVPFTQHQPGAFAIASINVGATGNLTVIADAGGAVLPMSVLLCPTDPMTGQCLQALASSLPVTIAAGATPTFSALVSATAPVAFAPATARIFVRFIDGSGQSHG